MQGRERTWCGVDGGLLALRWRGSWTVASGGAAAVRTAEGAAVALPFLLRMASPVFRWFPSSQYRLAFFVCLVLSLLFLSFLFVLSTSLCFLPLPFFFPPPYPSSVLSIYREKKRSRYASAPWEYITQRLVGH